MGLSKSAADKILQEARDFFAHSSEADSWNRKEALDDLKFVENIDGYQWTAQAREIRKGRPMITENRCPQFVRQVVNSIRRNRPGISVVPASSSATSEIADVLEGMTRHVEQRSRADMSYDGGAESAVKSSIGYWRVNAEYADGSSFDQELGIRPIRNPFTVYDDPECVMPDRSDRKKCIVSERVQREGFKDKYGVEPTPFESMTGAGDDILEWFDKDKVRIAEYWRCVYSKAKVYQDPVTGQAIPQDQIDEVRAKVLKARDVEKCSVEMHLITGDEIIESTDWPGKYIPIIAVVGEEADVEGKKYRKSLIRDAKDSQRAINYFASAEVEITSLTPKVPWVGPKGAFNTDATKWANMNVENYTHVEYDGNVAPTRTFPQFFADGVRECKLAAIESMKAIMGLYDASLGARSNETSGIAIENRAKQGDTSTFHFVDNYTRAIRFGGLVIVDLLPHYYDAARVVRILKADGEAEQQAINQVFVGAGGQLTQIDISQGEYDVVVSAGSYQTQRQENRDSMIQLSKVLPNMAAVAPDLIVKNFDFAEVDELAKRLKATVPPQILGDETQMPPEVQQAIQQVQQQQQELSQVGQQVEAERQKVDADKAVVEAKAQENASHDRLMAEQLKAAQADLRAKAAELRAQAAELQCKQIQCQQVVDAAAPHQPEMGPDGQPVPKGPSPDMQALAQAIVQASQETAQALVQASHEQTQALAAAFRAPRRSVPVRDDKGVLIASDSSVLQ